MRRSAMIFAILFGAATAPAWLHAPATSRAADVPPVGPAGPVIVELVGRNHKITISGSADQPRYTVHRHGKLITDRVTLSQLETLDPTSYEQVQSATAETSANGGAPTIWAGVE